jgi:hypothetical protein
VTKMTAEEWRRVQEALVKGGLRECIDNLLTSRVPLSLRNRRIIEEAYDDGGGNTIALVPTDDPPWFAGMYEDSEMMQGMEHQGTLYSIVHASGGGVCSVIVGRGLLNNEMGVAFPGVVPAKEYVKGLTAK